LQISLFFSGLIQIGVGSQIPTNFFWQIRSGKARRESHALEPGGCVGDRGWRLEAPGDIGDRGSRPLAILAHLRLRSDRYKNKAKKIRDRLCASGRRDGLPPGDRPPPPGIAPASYTVRFCRSGIAGPFAGWPITPQEGALFPSPGLERAQGRRVSAPSRPASLHLLSASVAPISFQLRLFCFSLYMIFADFCDRLLGATRDISDP
jgi:hypothetical protein